MKHFRIAWLFLNKNGHMIVKKKKVPYGVCDGATHSSAFFNQYVYNNNPSFWLSDRPHMIKKLRNFLISQNRNLKHSNYDISFDHLADVAERDQTKLSSKHLFLSSQTKMSVKLAVETCSREVADDILYNSKYGHTIALMTRTYIRKAAEYFNILNSISIDDDTQTH